MRIGLGAGHHVILVCFHPRLLMLWCPHIDRSGYWYMWPLCASCMLALQGPNQGPKMREPAALFTLSSLNERQFWDI